MPSGEWAAESLIFFNRSFETSSRQVAKSGDYDIIKKEEIESGVIMYVPGPATLALVRDQEYGGFSAWDIDRPGTKAVSYWFRDHCYRIRMNCA